MEFPKQHHPYTQCNEIQDVCWGSGSHHRSSFVWRNCHLDFVSINPVRFRKDFLFIWLIRKYPTLRDYIFGNMNCLEIEYGKQQERRVERIQKAFGCIVLASESVLLLLVGWFVCASWILKLFSVCCFGFSPKDVAVCCFLILSDRTICFAVNGGIGWSWTREGLPMPPKQRTNGCSCRPYALRSFGCI